MEKVPENSQNDPEPVHNPNPQQTTTQEPQKAQPTTTIIEEKPKSNSIKPITEQALNRFYRISTQCKEDPINHLLVLERLVQMLCSFIPRNMDTKLEFSPLDVTAFFIEKANKSAVDSFNKKDYNKAKEEISRVIELMNSSGINEIFSKGRMKLEEAKVLTFNNLSCIYRKNGDHAKSLKVLDFVVGIEEKLAVKNPISGISIISSYLNKAAVQSEMKCHKESLYSVRMAESHLRKALKRYGASTPEGTHVKYLEMLTHYNLGSEHEHLKEADAAVKNYKRAYDLAKEQGRNDFIQELEKILKIGKKF
jgi:tetratricopeptide (TPR) repeat protein